MPMESLLSENVKLKLEEKFGSITSNFEHEVLSVLALTCDEGSVTNERLRYSLNLHKGQISELLKRMLEWISLEDIALRIGKDYKYLRNHIIPRMLKEKNNRNAIPKG